MMKNYGVVKAQFTSIIFLITEILKGNSPKYKSVLFEDISEEETRKK